MSNAVLEKLIRDIADSIRVLRVRDGIQVSDELCTERARGLTTYLVTHYEMRPLPEHRPPAPWIDWETPLISRHPKVQELSELAKQGKLQGHGTSCRCDRCDTFNRSVKQ